MYVKVLFVVPFCNFEYAKSLCDNFYKAMTSDTFFYQTLDILTYWLCLVSLI